MTGAQRFCAALMLAVAVVTAAVADEGLEQAQKLVQAQDYGAAQKALADVDRDGLSDADKIEYDRLKDLLTEAVPGAERAAQSLAEADKAFQEGRWDEADGLYSAVAENFYATEAQLAHARTQRQRVVEKKQLAEVARPEGPVNGGDSGEITIQLSPPAEETKTTVTVSESESDEPTRMTLVDELRARDRILWQRAVARMENNARNARQAVADELFDEARSQAELAVQIIETARAYADPPDSYLAAKSRADALLAEVQTAAAEYERRLGAMTIDETRRQIEIRKAAQEKLRRDKIEQLFNTADQLRRERRFAEAAETIRQIRYLDPSNARAKGLLEIYEDMRSLDYQRDIKETRRYQERESLTEVKEALIPWNQNVLYPKNWRELTIKRADLRPYGTGEDDGLNRLLDKPKSLSDFRFQDAPLEQVMESLRSSSGLNIHVDWNDLEARGIERTRPVSMQLRDVSYRTALRELLTQAGGDIALGFTSEDGVLRIASRDKLDRDKDTLVYDIRDLLIDVPRFAGPKLTTSDDGTTITTVSAAGVNSLFKEKLDALEEGPRAETRNDSLVAQLLEIVQSTVEPDSWSVRGGDGSLHELNGQLIVYNTSEAQRQVSHLLEQLRATRALQIAVEGRFLIVTSNFLEEIGVDLDFVFNSGSAGYDRAFNNQGAVFDNFTGAPVLIPRQVSRVGAAPAVPGVGGDGFTRSTSTAQPYTQPGFIPVNSGVGPSGSQFTPVPANAGSINLVDPGEITSQVPGSFGGREFQPGLLVAGSFLDNLQVDFLIRATQANRRSSIVQAPRLMMFNGQRAFVAIQRTRSYVSSLTPAVAEGAVGVTPVQAQIASGTVLDVEGTISADRRYVTLTVQTSLAEEPSFERFQIQSGSGNSPGQFIQLPDQQTRIIRTTVSVPDGGTVLLGGLKQSGEVEVEAGVPILSKIPILKRAFTNATTVKDTQTLLILLKAKILIQKEAEEDVFPGLTATGG